MVVGTVAMLLAVSPSAATFETVALGPAALVLALGTYLVGTDMDGRPV
jgi:hypothetical protein